eukprot:6202323-Pleurochrysis_carterae.AAC.1
MQLTRRCLPAPARRSPGELVFVPRRLWPAHACCHENGGGGWTERVLSLTKRSVLVAFPFAADEHGLRYALVTLHHTFDYHEPRSLPPCWRYARD